MSEILFCWPISSFYGWGIRGLGMALNWDGIAASVIPELNAELPVDDPRTQLFLDRIQNSRNVQETLLNPVGMFAPAGPEVTVDAPVLVALGNDLFRISVAYGRSLRGKPTVGCLVFEDVETVENNIHKLKDYDIVVVASRWNQEVLESLGVSSVLCHEGIDPVIFNPSVRRRFKMKSRSSGISTMSYDGRFRVFSGGKAEYRKGQDLVMQAFKIFAEKHDDAVLVCAWGSPWGTSAMDFEGKWEYGAPPGIHIGMPNYVAWAQRAGIKPHQIEFVPVMPNWKMAEVYGGVDVAVFPNRREGGTNFVAMECMACGVPTILTHSYGQEDLPVDALAYLLPPGETRAHIECIVEGLETVYHHSKQLIGLGPYWTWKRHCDQLAEIIRA